MLHRAYQNKIVSSPDHPVGANDSYRGYADSLMECAGFGDSLMMSRYLFSTTTAAVQSLVSFTWYGYRRIRESSARAIAHDSHDLSVLDDIDMAIAERGQQS